VTATAAAGRLHARHWSPDFGANNHGRRPDCWWAQVAESYQGCGFAQRFLWVHTRQRLGAGRLIRACAARACAPVLPWGPVSCGAAPGGDGAAPGGKSPPVAWPALGLTSAADATELIRWSVFGPPRMLFHCSVNLAESRGPLRNRGSAGGQAIALTQSSAAERTRGTHHETREPYPTRTRIV